MFFEQECCPKGQTSKERDPLMVQKLQASKLLTHQAKVSTPLLMKQGGGVACANCCKRQHHVANLPRMLCKAYGNPDCNAFHIPVGRKRVVCFHAPKLGELLPLAFTFATRKQHTHTHLSLSLSVSLCLFLESNLFCSCSLFSFC